MDKRARKAQSPDNDPKRQRKTLIAGPPDVTIEDAPKAPAARPSRPGKAVKASAKSSKKASGPNVPAAPTSWHDVGYSLPTARDLNRVSVDSLVRRTPATLLPETPQDTPGLFQLVGSTARRALLLGLTAREPNFHVFVAVDPDVAIEEDIVGFAERYTRDRPTPLDLVYVHDFDHPEAPIPLCLPSGTGPAFVEAMSLLVERLRTEIPALTTHEALKAAQVELATRLEGRQKELVSGIEITAKTLGFGIRSVHGGLQTFPILHGKPLTPEQYGVLDDSTKRALTDAEERLTKEVEKAASMVREESSQYEEAKSEAFRAAAETVVGHCMEQLREALADFGEGVQTYLKSVEAALMTDWRDFLIDESPGAGGGDESGDDPEHAQSLARFNVNLQVTHEPGSPPPVVYETNPTYPNLFGYLERRVKYGALLTDYMRVRPGAFHRAAGGVLVVRATDLMTDPIIWERTKRILRERQIAPEDPLGPLGLYATTLRPRPIPVPLRMIVVGTSENYSILLEADPDFAALFRVKVEIESSVPRTNESIVALDALVMKMARERSWGPFTREARAKLMDLAMRLAGDQDRLSISLGPVEETAAFASALAAARSLEEKAPPADDHAGDPGVPSLRRPFRASRVPAPTHPVTEEEILLAWRERRERTGAAERQFRDLILRGEISVETSASRVGVINGLSLLIMGDVEFGQPMRISAVVALGREGLVDVEREAQLSGAIHTKGVAILRGYLAGMFGQERPVSLRAQLAFEQSYGEIDGDSASCAELYALLSALADVGIDQGIAVTGSMNQLGAVQAVGGVCAKIEGFFDVCNARGLTGSQGVLIPRSNLPHIVLRDDVVTAIEQGLFHVYAVDNVAAGIEILTGLSAGVRDASGRFPASSVFGRVERRLIEIAERTRQAEGTAHIPSAHESMEDVSVADLGGDDR